MRLSACERIIAANKSRESEGANVAKRERTEAACVRV